MVHLANAVANGGHRTSQSFGWLVDDDGSGTIEYEEFPKMMTHKILNRDPKDEILKAFRLFDDDETGKISFKKMKRVATVFKNLNLLENA